jgi:hypothetical protein
MQRLLIEAIGPDDDAVVHGFRWLIGFARDQDAPRCGLFVPAIGSAENLARPLGDVGARLARERSLQAEGLTVELLAPRSLRHGTYDSPILAIWVDDDMIDKIEEARPTAICAIPWSETDLKAWKAAWQPGDPRAGTPAGAGGTISNPVVEAAMASLTARVNLSMALAHPSDRAAAVWAFKLLKQAGEPFDPGEIRSWAVTHHWRPQDAKEIADIAQKFLDGRRVQAGPRGWAKDIIKQWRETAAGER